MERSSTARVIPPEGVAAKRVARSSRLLIVSNRLPQTVRVEGSDVWTSPSSGGLATGLGKVHQRAGGRWIGWSGTRGPLPWAIQRAIERRLAQVNAHGVFLTEAEIRGFYRDFATGVLWPVLHESAPTVVPGEGAWATYRSVNARFAEAVLDEVRPGDRVWLHDYHLMLLPQMLRERQPDVPLAFFLHTPFPSIDALTQVPWAKELLRGLLGADVLGFQTSAHLACFVEAVQRLWGCDARCVSGSGVVRCAGREVRLHASPVSIDVAAFAGRAEHPEVLRRAIELRARGGPLFIGVDRLDPTKGILERVAAFERLLEQRPDLRGRARLFQLAVPSREEVPAYRQLRSRVEACVQAINTRFAIGDWRPIEYAYRTADELELAALYRAADVMLVTPLRDGMNLVAKEFVATRTDLDGVLVLSVHAGAAVELTTALPVEPTDIDGMAQAYAAALEMSPLERQVRMRRLRTRVRLHDVRHWSDECLHQLAAGGSAARSPAS
jgi:trehalose 6-phosphate synthase/phosphatase